MGWLLQFRQLLDIYANRWPQRLAVLALFALAGLLLAAHRLEAVLPIALLVWSNQERFIVTMSDVLRRRPWLVVAAPLAAMGGRIAWPAPAAHDDLLRHIVSSFWPGGYRDMYVHTSLPPNDLYPTFDRLVGILAQQVGPVTTMWIVQGIAWLAFITVFAVAAFRLVPRSDDRPFWVGGALILVVSTVAIRLSLGRPEVFMGIWAISAILPRDRAGIAVWAGVGIALSTGYWLAPVYFPAVLLLVTSARSRALLFAGMCASWVGLWIVLTGSDPLEALRWGAEALRHRAEDVMVEENLSILNLLSMPGFIAIAGAAIWAVRRAQGNIRLLLLAGYFLLSNQGRYVLPVAPLLALFALSAVGQQWRSLTPSLRIGTFVASILLGAAVVTPVPRLHELPRFELPPGSVVLTAFSPATYAIPFFNPGSVRVAPAFEIGAAEPWLQSLIVEMARGEFDCRALGRGAFTHVVERELRVPAPACLDLMAVDGAWRLWRVRD